MAVENENKLSEIIRAFADAGFINDVILIGSCLGVNSICVDNFCAVFARSHTLSVIQNVIGFWLKSFSPNRQ